MNIGYLNSAFILANTTNDNFAILLKIAILHTLLRTYTAPRVKQYLFFLIVVRED